MTDKTPETPETPKRPGYTDHGQVAEIQLHDESSEPICAICRKVDSIKVFAVAHSGQAFLEPLSPETIQQYQIICQNCGAKIMFPGGRPYWAKFFRKEKRNLIVVPTLQGTRGKE